MNPKYRFIQSAICELLKCGIPQETVTNVKDTTTYLHLDVGYGQHAWATAAQNAFITPRRHGHVSLSVRSWIIFRERRNTNMQLQKQKRKQLKNKNYEKFRIDKNSNNLR